MTDYFALLGESRRPWLDANALKHKFLTLSANLHPDRMHEASTPQKILAQDRYAELNAAYQCLREPKERLRHLLELERGGKLDQLQNIPPGLMEVSLQVGSACREADGILKEKSNASSPLLRVSLFEREQEQVQKLSTLTRLLETHREALLEQVKGMDARWENGQAGGVNPDLLSRLEELYRLLSYYERWGALVRERIVQLSL